MKRFFALALTLALLIPASGENKCLTCHEPQGVQLKASAHPATSCVACHNGNEDAEDMDLAHKAVLPSAKFIGRPKAAELVAMCASCHKKESMAWRESPHFEGMSKGDPSGADCMSCHALPAALSTHAIIKKDVPGSPTARPNVPAACARCHANSGTMARSGVRTDSMAQYELSMHGALVIGDPTAEAATCADCHEAHESRRASDPKAWTHPINQSKSCGGCHGDQKFMTDHGRDWTVIAKFDASPHARNLASGAPSCTGCHTGHLARVPPAAEISATCGKCHTGPARELAAGPHGKAEVVDEAAGTSDLIHCAHCHDSHGAPRPAAPFGTTNCATCHKPGSQEITDGNRMSDISAATKSDLFNLHGLLSKARARGHDFGERCAALDSLDARYHDIASLVHGVRPQKCERARKEFETEAAELKARLKPLAEPERRIGWLSGLWAFLFVGLALMWAKSRR